MRQAYISMLVGLALAAPAASADYNDGTTLLSGFSELWRPGATWDTGVPVNPAVLKQNIQMVVDATRARSPEQDAAAYFDDRTAQSYSVISGLGPLTSHYLAGSGATTTIGSIPADATTRRYDDAGTGAGLETSALGKVVMLVNEARGPHASSNPAKAAYDYPRPFRQSLDVIVVPALAPAISPTPANDGGFPSGHTNAAYLAGLMMAYAIPERFQELLTRSSEVSNNRVVAGMHSPLDVIGGRILAHSNAAATLADPANAELKRQARNQARAYLSAQCGKPLELCAHAAERVIDRFSDRDRNKADFTQRLTYGFAPIHAVTSAMVVPAGADVLLETRLPYLTAEQRREVLRTTGLPSGYPVMDDLQGWGRLDLFAAADGYGAFAADVTVVMDAVQGGFSAADAWRNDISGPGKLTKRGAGALTLTGKNTYSGGTQIDGGMLIAASATAFGTGDVVLTGGTLRGDAIVSGKLTNTGGILSPGNAIGTLRVSSHFAQSAAGILALEVAGDTPGEQHDQLAIVGKAELGGKLRISFLNGFAPSHLALLELVDCEKRTGVFSDVEIEGLPSGMAPRLIYAQRGVFLLIEAVPVDDFARGRSSVSE